MSLVIFLELQDMLCVIYVGNGVHPTMVNGDLKQMKLIYRYIQIF